MKTNTQLNTQTNTQPNTLLNNKNSTHELVINWHITEVCNYSCTYCFAKWNRPNELHRNDEDVSLLMHNLAKHFLSEQSLLKQSLQYKHVRINFAGGEPLILGSKFFDIVHLAKSLGFKTSIITNGHFLATLQGNIPKNLFDVVGISYDSQQEDICKKIGRVDRKGKFLSPIDVLLLANSIRSTQEGVLFKLNTVVNVLNQHEDFSDFINVLSPDKWKMFQVQPFSNHKLLITKPEFDAFVNRHRNLDVDIFDENNQEMTDSYLMIDPKGRFYQNSNGTHDSFGYVYSGLINEVGVAAALKQINFDQEKYLKRYVPAEPIVINTLAV